MAGRIIILALDYCLAKSEADAFSYKGRSIETDMLSFNSHNYARNINQSGTQTCTDTSLVSCKTQVLCLLTPGKD